MAVAVFSPGEPMNALAGSRASRLLLALALLLTTLATSLPVRAALLGNNFTLSGPGCRFPDVAYGSVSGQYLVVWTDYNVARIFGRFVSAAGAPGSVVFPISEAPFGALYPTIAFNAANNEFLVTWDDAGDRGGVIYGGFSDSSQAFAFTR